MTAPARGPAPPARATAPAAAPGVTACDAGTPHPVTTRCPLACLRPGLPARAFNPLRSHLGPGATIAHLAAVCRAGDLACIHGTGPRAAAQVRAALAAAGGLPGP